MQGDQAKINWPYFKVNLALLTAAGHIDSCKLSLFYIREALRRGETSEAETGFDNLHWSAQHDHFPVTPQERRELENLFTSIHAYQAARV